MADKHGMVSTIRHHRKNNFVIVDRAIIEDKRLSWKAKGLMMYLLDQSDGWQFYESEIVTHSKDGRESTANGLLELEKYGYLIRTWIRDEKGRYIGRDWDVYENPLENPNTDSNEPDCGFSETGETDIGEPATNNNNNNNNNNNKNNNNTPFGGDLLQECCCHQEGRKKSTQKSRDIQFAENQLTSTLISEQDNFNSVNKRAGDEPQTNKPKKNNHNDTSSDELIQGQDTSGSKIPHKKIKDIMHIYKIKVFRQEVLEVLSKYSETELHKIGQTLQNLCKTGKVKNPSGLLINNPEEICQSILSGQLYPSRPKQNTASKTYPNEYMFYVPPEVLEELKSSGNTNL